MGFTLNPFNRKIWELSLLKFGEKCLPLGHSGVLQGDHAGTEEWEADLDPHRPVAMVCACVCTCVYVCVRAHAQVPEHKSSHFINYEKTKVPTRAPRLRDLFLQYDISVHYLDQLLTHKITVDQESQRWGLQGTWEELQFKPSFHRRREWSLRVEVICPRSHS